MGVRNWRRDPIRRVTAPAHNGPTQKHLPHRQDKARVGLRAVPIYKNSPPPRPYSPPPGNKS